MPLTTSSRAARRLLPSPRSGTHRGVESTLRELHVASFTCYRWCRARKEPCERVRKDVEFTDRIRESTPIPAGSTAARARRFRTRGRPRGPQARRSMREADLAGLSHAAAATRVGTPRPPWPGRGGGGHHCARADPAVSHRPHHDHHDRGSAVALGDRGCTLAPGGPGDRVEPAPGSCGGGGGVVDAGSGHRLGAGCVPGGRGTEDELAAVAGCRLRRQGSWGGTGRRRTWSERIWPSTCTGTSFRGKTRRGT